MVPLAAFVSGTILVTWPPFRPLAPAAIKQTSTELAEWLSGSIALSMQQAMAIWLTLALFLATLGWLLWCWIAVMNALNRYRPESQAYGSEIEDVDDKPGLAGALIWLLEQVLQLRKADKVKDTEIAELKNAVAKLSKEHGLAGYSRDKGDVDVEVGATAVQPQLQVSACEAVPDVMDGAERPSESEGEHVADQDLWREESASEKSAETGVPTTLSEEEERVISVWAPPLRARDLTQLEGLAAQDGVVRLKLAGNQLAPSPGAVELLAVPLHSDAHRSNEYALVPAPRYAQHFSTRYSTIASNTPETVRAFEFRADGATLGLSLDQPGLARREGDVFHVTRKGVLSGFRP